MVKQEQAVPTPPQLTDEPWSPSEPTWVLRFPSTEDTPSPILCIEDEEVAMLTGGRSHSQEPLPPLVTPPSMCWDCGGMSSASGTSSWGFSPWDGGEIKVFSNGGEGMSRETGLKCSPKATDGLLREMEVWRAETEIELLQDRSFLQGREKRPRVEVKEGASSPSPPPPLHVIPRGKS
ncbi:unnamed protein product [Discosporangium mesarthrocarpum]